LAMAASISVREVSVTTKSGEQMVKTAPRSLAELSVDLADGSLDMSAAELFNMVDKDGDGAIGLKEFADLHRTISDSTKVQAKKEMAAIFEADKQRRAKHTVSLVALVVSLLLVVSLIANGVATSFIIDFAIKTSTDNNALTVKGSSAIVATSEATVGVPLYVAPVLPIEQLGAIRWLSAKHLAVVGWRFVSAEATPAVPPANATSTGSNSTLAPFTPPVGERTDLLAMVNSVFHIREVLVYSATHVDFHTEGGRKIEIKHGDATLVDPLTGVRRSLCVANVSCASFSVDADEADGLHEAALRALITGGFPIDDDIRSLSVVQRLLSGPLAADVAAAEEAPFGGRRMQDGERRAWAETDLGIIRQLGASGLVCAQTGVAAGWLGDYFRCITGLSMTTGRGWAHFYLKNELQLEHLGLGWVPRSIVMSYTTSEDDQRRVGFDGGTLVERYCAEGSFVGQCKMRYTYTDNRLPGLAGRTSFELLWSCNQGPDRVCSVVSGHAEYAAEARVPPYNVYQRAWRVDLASNGAGSVKLPAFRSCDWDCRCASFPKLVWDARSAAAGGQKWNEDADPESCSDTGAIISAVESCNGGGGTAQSFVDASSSQREAALSAGQMYSNYDGLMMFSRSYDGSSTWNEFPWTERRNEIWVTLGNFQRKYAPWLNAIECAQPKTSATITAGVDIGDGFVAQDADTLLALILGGGDYQCEDRQLDSNYPLTRTGTIQWPNTFNDFDAARPNFVFDYSTFDVSNPPADAANSNICQYPVGGFTAGSGEDRRLHDTPSEIGGLFAVKRELGRGVGSGSAGSGRLQGCARHATCATRGRRAPPVRP